MSVVGSNYLPPSIETFSKPSVLKSYLRTSCCRSFLVTCSYLCCFFFFLSSRRRHTRCLSVWSSDVCSSDLVGPVPLVLRLDIRDFFKGPTGRRLLTPPVLAHIEAQYQRHGTYGIFVSRLLPVWRAVVDRKSVV